MKKLIFCLIFMVATLPKTALADWKLWVVPESRSVNVGDPLKFVFGITGGGALKPENIKVLIYSEADSRLKREGDNKWIYDTYAILLNSSTPKDAFEKPNSDILTDNQKILLEAEQKTPFNPIYVKPESPGDKNITIVLSYKDNEEKWRTISKNFSYHAKSFVEQYEKFGFVLAILLALIGIWKDTLWKGISFLLIKHRNKES